MSDWKTDREGFHLAVTVPANATATVSLPVPDAAKVREGELPASKAAGVKLLGVAGGRTLFEVGSGTYHFTAPAP